MFTLWTISNPLIETPDMFAYVDITSPDGTTQRQILQLPHPGQRRVQLPRSKTGPGWQIKMNAVQRLPLSLVDRHGVGRKNRKLSETSDNPGIQARIAGWGDPDGIFVVKPSISTFRKSAFAQTGASKAKIPYRCFIRNSYSF